MKTILILSVAFAAAMSQKISKNYYFELKDTTDWLGAFDKCRERGARLATIRNADEQDAIRRYIEFYNVTGDALYVGGTDLLVDGVFMWHGTGEQIQYAPWASGEPNTCDGRLHCIRVLKDEWKVFSCNDIKPFICEDIV